MFWDYTLLGNTMLEYAYALAAFAGFLIVLKVVQLLVLRYLKKLALRTQTDVDDTLVKIVGVMRPPFYSFLAFYFTLFFLNIKPIVRDIIDGILIIWVVYQAIKAIQVLVDYAVKKRFSGEGTKEEQGIVSFMSGLTKGALWIVGALLVLSNLGINITSLVAGLGIGGLAVAFALQKIFADLFSSFAIYLDKPFEVGDFISAGGDSGTVKKIGIKTTRIKTLQGEELVISNQEITSTRVQNFSRMKKRRVAFDIGVEYDTPNEKLKLIPGMIKKAIEAQENVKFDRAHFKQFGDSALLFEVVYFVQSSDFVAYRDVHEKIHIEIKNVFERNGIVFAFPTQTVHVKK